MALEVGDAIALQPVAVKRSMREDKWRGITSGLAGSIIPVAYFPLLREDRISGRIEIKVNMAPTVRTLLNAVKARATAYLYPLSADPNFTGMDEFNASYQGVGLAGAAVKPFVPTAVPGNSKGTGNIYEKLGLHFRTPSTQLQAEWLPRAYNAIVNHRRAQRSVNLSLRGVSDKTLARAFWLEPERFLVVPDFDHAQMEGELLQPLAGTAAVSGATADLSTGFSVTSLANLKMLEQTQAFARLRDAYADRTDDYLIDLLMEGIRVPESSLREPQMLGAASGIFGMQERYAADGASLGDYVATGEVRLSMQIATPAINPGGVVLVCVEIVPEPLPEWAADRWLEVKDPSFYPNAMRDELDPEKVGTMNNQDVDVHHANPTAVFGYSHMNWQWNRNRAMAGGKFYADSGDTWSEDRSRFWQVSRVNPVLNTDWYLCPKPFPHDVFADTVTDPFEIITRGEMTVVGNTVFGPRLRENRDAFGDVIADVPVHSRSAGGVGLSGHPHSGLDAVVDRMIAKAPRQKRAPASEEAPAEAPEASEEAE